MITLLIYLKNVKKPFEIVFESKIKLHQFYEDLSEKEIISIGPLTFSKSEFKYCLQK